LAVRKPKYSPKAIPLNSKMIAAKETAAMKITP
jgi:hypothetical protein